jgi:hypothetical protein
LSGIAAASYPKALLPTRLPPKIGFADIGFSCSTLGVGGPPCVASLHYITRPTAGKGAFQLAIFNGRVASKVVQALLRHDGRFGTTSSFTAGRFAGTRERQWDKPLRIGGVDTYVWQHKETTYALIVRFLNSGAQAFPGTVPRTIIASFSPVAGAAPKVLPSAATVTMPNLVGLTEAAAIAAGNKAGVDVRRFGTAPAPTPAQVGLVVSTFPGAGASVPRGTLVRINIGTG